MEIPRVVKAAIQPKIPSIDGSKHGRLLPYLIFMVKRSGELEMPGGKVRDNETLPTAIKREVLEETGLEIEILEDSARWIAVYKDVALMAGVTFHCIATGGSLKVSDEHVAALWVPLDWVGPLDCQHSEKDAFRVTIKQMDQ